MKKIVIILVATLIFLIPNIHNSASCEEYSLDATNCYNEGITQYQAHSYKAAIISFQRAVQIEPTFTDAYYNLAEIYKYLNQNENAIITYAKLLNINPNDYDADFEIAKVYAKQANYTIALKYSSDIPESYQKYQEVLNFQKETKDIIYKLEQEKIAKNNAKIKLSEPITKTFIDKFESPTGITTDSQGNLYIACYSTNYISKISPDKKKTVFAKSKLINGPIGLATDKFDNIYVANYESNNILKISPLGIINVFMNKISKPYCLYIKNDILYVSEQGTNTVIKYNLK